MAGTFLDSFLPAITGDLAQIPGAMAQGQLQGMTAAQQLALLDAQIKQQQIQNMQAQRAMQQPKAQYQLHNLGAGAFVRTDAMGNIVGEVQRPPAPALPAELQMLGMFQDPNRQKIVRDYYEAKRGPQPPIVVPPGSTVLPQEGMNQPPPTQPQDPSQAWRSSVPPTLAGPLSQPATSAGRQPYTAPSRPQNLNPTEQVIQKVAASGVQSLNPGERAIWDMYQQKNTPAQKGTPGQNALDAAFAKDYASFVAGGGYADVEKQLGQLRSAVQSLKTDSSLTGPFVGLVPDAIRNVTNPASIAVRDQVMEVVQRNLRMILGPQFTEREGMLLMRRAYNEQQPPEENIKRMTRLIAQIEAAAKAKADAGQYFEQHGTLQGWKGKMPSLSDFNPEAGAMPTAQAPAPAKPMKQGSAIRFNQLTKQGKTKQEAFQIMKQEGY